MDNNHKVMASDAGGELDYPVAAPDDIAPVIFRAMIIQTMALHYFNAMRGSPEEYTLENGFEAARATWETEWESDPAPRTMEAAIYEADQEMQYWTED